MKIPRVNRSYWHLKRYQQIIGVFFKYGFADVLNRINIATRLKVTARIKPKGKAKQTMTPAQRFRCALEELGPTFIKVGQLLSTRSFLLPPSYIDELAKLQDEVKPVPFDQIREVIEEEFGDTLDSLFLSFDPKPIASASIAQAHRAALHTGEKVILKIQRPHLRRIIETDMAILRNLAGLIDRHIEESRQYDPVAVVDELRRSMRQELDFTHEARSVEQFHQNFVDETDIYIPKIYWDYCSRKIVALEYIDGIKISNLEEIDAHHFERRKLAKIGTRFILKQIFIDGFFHADPHPGNLFVTKEGKLAPIDFGIMGRLDQHLMDEISDVLIAIWRRDVDLILRVLVNIGALDLDADQQLLRTELAEFIHRYYGITLDKVDMNALIRESLDLFTRHNLKVPSNLILLGKTLGTYENLGRLLDPKFNFFDEIKPYAQKLFLRRLDPQKFSYEALKTARDIYDLIKIMPHELELLLRRMRRGRMAIEFQHRGLENLIRGLDRSFNRLAFSLIIAALFVASSLIMRMEKGPTLLGYPFFGLIGYIVAAIMGFGLIFAILHSRKF